MNLLNPYLRYLMATCLIACALPVNAALVTLCGPNICYEYDNDPLANPGVGGAAFGTPTLLTGSDVLAFTPTAFAAEAQGVGGTDTNVQSFTFTRIYSLTGAELVNLSASESGDYQIINGGTVSAQLDLEITDLVDDLGTTGFPESATSGGTFSSSSPTGFVPAEWSLDGSISPSAAFDDLASEISLMVTNTLQADTTAAGEYARIDKKLFLTVTTIVPVPAAVWLFGSALLGLGALRRMSGSRA